MDMKDLTVGRIVFFGLAFVVVFGMLGGCETVKGAGRDLTNAGQRVQDVLP
jgi:predicted small secreted protein